MKKKTYLLSLTAGLLCLGGAALAADSVAPAHSLKEVVVTGAKEPQAREAETRKIGTVYSDESEQMISSKRNMAELLQYEPGMFVLPLSRNDANWGSYGGLGPKYNSHLVDGLPVDSFVDAMGLDPWAVERVESQRGPASVLYSNYMSMDFAGNQTPLAGVSNFILRDRIDKSATRILVGGGSYDTMNGRFYHQDRKGPISYFFGANYEKSDYTNYGTPNSWLNMIKDPQYEKTKLYGKTTFTLGRDDHKISLFVNHAQHTGDAGRPNRDYDHNYDLANIVYSNRISDGVDLSFKTGFRNYDRRWAEDNFPTDLGLREHDGVKQTIIPADLTLNLKHAGNGLLTAGVDYQDVSYKTYAEVAGVRSYGNSVTATSAGLFLQDKVAIGDLVLRAGGRINRTHHEYELIGGATPGLSEQSWTKFLWSGGARYNILKTLSVYGNVGNSFVAPSAKSVGGTIKATDNTNGQLPNADLKPESGIAYDLGIDFQPIPTLSVGLRGFMNVVKDSIVTNVVSLSPSQSRDINAGKATSVGAELEIRHELASYLSWFGNATVTSTEVKSSLDPDQDGADLSFVPKYVTNLGATARLPFDITVSPYVQSVGRYFDSTSKSGRREFGGHTVINLKVSEDVVKSADYAVTASLDLYNLTNRKNEMPWQFRDPGFSTFASLELKF